MQKHCNKSKLILSNLFCFVMPIALILNSFLISQNTFQIGGLVYCPLQKIWVKQSGENQIVRLNPLDLICMSDSKKYELALQISSKNAFAIDEKGIFETLESGVKVLDDYRENPNLPNQNLAQIRLSFSVLNNKNEWKPMVAAKSEAFSFQLFSRPPTAPKSTKFDFQITKSLDQISHNINPRSPPFFI